MTSTIRSSAPVAPVHTGLDMAAHVRRRSSTASRARSPRYAERPPVARDRRVRSTPGHTPGVDRGGWRRVSLLPPPRFVVREGLKAHISAFDLDDLGRPRA